MTEQGIAKIKALAEKATKGPWMRLFGERTVYDRMEDGCRGNPIVRADSAFGSDDANNLDFIAAANPAAILALIADLEAMRKDAGWISVNERLPSKYTEVMVWPHPSDYCLTAELYGESASGNPVWKYGEYTNGWGHENIEITRPVTHWMPLPQPPKADDA